MGNKYIRLVQWLLNRGANINNAIGRSGNALQVVARNGNTIIVKGLLNAGAEVNT